MTYQLWLGDCLEEMDRIEAGSVDMICADLPYGTTACKWDVVIPFEPLWKQYKRVIKRNGAIVLFGSEPFSSFLRLSNLDWYKYDWVWKKDRPSGQLTAKVRPMKYHENIMVFSSGQSIYNPQKTTGHKPVNNPGKNSRLAAVYGKDGWCGKGGETERYPSSVIDYNTPNSAHGILHPTQKPVALLSYLIRTYTNPGELVLDNTCGSGSTLEAAELTGRNSIGIEKDAGYYQIASNRLEQVVKKLNNQDLPMFAIS